jgi:hypothetical protein
MNVMGRAVSVGIATRYRLDDPGVGSRWKRDIPRPSRAFVACKKGENYLPLAFGEPG